MNPSDDACGAQQVQRYVGLSYMEAIGERLEEESGAGAVRVKRPGMAYTLEYRADRLDVGVDEAEIIQTIQCGQVLAGTTMELNDGLEVQSHRCAGRGS